MWINTFSFHKVFKNVCLCYFTVKSVRTEENFALVYSRNFVVCKIYKVVNKCMSNSNMFGYDMSYKKQTATKIEHNVFRDLG